MLCRSICLCVCVCGRGVALIVHFRGSLLITQQIVSAWAYKVCQNRRRICLGVSVWVNGSHTRAHELKATSHPHFVEMARLHSFDVSGRPIAARGERMYYVSSNIRAACAMKLIAVIRPFLISIERRTLMKPNYVPLQQKTKGMKAGEKKAPKPILVCVLFYQMYFVRGAAFNLWGNGSR